MKLTNVPNLTHLSEAERLALAHEARDKLDVGDTVRELHAPLASNPRFARVLSVSEPKGLIRIELSGTAHVMNVHPAEWKLYSAGTNRNRTGFEPGDPVRFGVAESAFDTYGKVIAVEIAHVYVEWATNARGWYSADQLKSARTVPVLMIEEGDE